MLKRIDVVDPGPADSARAAKHVAVFYTSLYRALTFPRLLSEVTSNGVVKHYSPYDRDGKVYNGYLVTDNGFWDTFRTVYPLLSVAYPDYLAMILKGWLNAYLEGGWLPTWASPGYRNCMVGTYADVVLADALIKNISFTSTPMYPGGRSVDPSVGKAVRVSTNVYRTIFEALEKDLNEKPPDFAGGAVGRDGKDEYERLGYLSVDNYYSDCVSRSLDFGYADYAISQLYKNVFSKMKEFREMKDKLLARSKTLRDRADRVVKSLFDSSTGLMTPKDTFGNFKRNLSPEEWGGGYVEGNPWQYAFPPWALSLLIKLHGGQDKIRTRLSRMLGIPSHFQVGFRRWSWLFNVFWRAQGKLGEAAWRLF